MTFHQKSMNKCYNISQVRELTFALGVRRSFLKKVTIKTDFEKLDLGKEKYKSMYSILSVENSQANRWGQADKRGILWECAP